MLFFPISLQVVLQRLVKCFTLARGREFIIVSRTSTFPCLAGVTIHIFLSHCIWISVAFVSSCLKKVGAHCVL